MELLGLDEDKCFKCSVTNEARNKPQRGDMFLTLYCLFECRVRHLDKDGEIKMCMSYNIFTQLAHTEYSD